MSYTECSTHNPRVLVFDSGVGGLSIARAIKQQHAYIDIIYASDNAAFPYGTKPEAVLIARITTVIKQLQRQIHADMIVIACNTASTVALPALREVFKTPVIGVVPAVKPAAVLSKSKVIGLLATPGTIARSYTHELIQNFAVDCRFIFIGSEKLVTLAEHKLQGFDIAPEEINDIVGAFKEDNQIDTIVLACTHFPLLIDELQVALPNITYWVDSGDAIARRVDYWLSELNLAKQPKIAVKHQCIFTEETPVIEHLQNALEREGLREIQFMPLAFRRR